MKRNANNLGICVSQNIHYGHWNHSIIQEVHRRIVWKIETIFECSLDQILPKIDFHFNEISWFHLYSRYDLLISLEPWEVLMDADCFWITRWFSQIHSSLFESQPSEPSYEGTSKIILVQAVCVGMAEIKSPKYRTGFPATLAPQLCVPTYVLLSSGKHLLLSSVNIVHIVKMHIAI